MGAAFIVDGQTEKKIIQHICPEAPIRMTNLNGKNVNIAAIAKTVSSFIKLFKGRYFPVFVLVDREGRNQSAEEIERLLHHELVDCYGLAANDVIVSCPDRMIENWMLADSTYFNRVHGILIESILEGKNGKKELRRLLSEKKIAYHELTVGVEIFVRINPAEMRRNSLSFRRLAERSENICRWMRIMQSVKAAGA